MSRPPGRRPNIKAGLHRSLRAWPGFALDEVARLVRSEGEAALARTENGLHWNDVVLLTVLASFRDGLSQTALRERTGLDRTTFGQIAGDLEHDGHVRRRPSRRDGRELMIACTSFGRTQLAEARNVLERAERDALRRLQARERRRLHQQAARALPVERHPFAVLFH